MKTAWTKDAWDEPVQWPTSTLSKGQEQGQGRR
jgi:hypothetical protein